jgi:hypothetical protein
VFRDAVKLGFVSDCRSLASVDYGRYLDWPLGDIRRDLNLEEDLLRAYSRSKADATHTRSRASVC